MKKMIAFFTVLGIVLINCTGESPTSGLKDDENRREIYAEILDNHHYLKEFIDSMRTSDHARMMMHSDTAMTNNLVHDMPAEKMLGHLMAKVEDDSTACKMMCGAMMDHKKVMATMLETLDKGGMVDKSCMKKKKEAKAEHTH